MSVESELAELKASFNGFRVGATRRFEELESELVFLRRIKEAAEEYVKEVDEWHEKNPEIFRVATGMEAALICAVKGRRQRTPVGAANIT
jgi:hypothetical protein